MIGAKNILLNKKSRTGLKFLIGAAFVVVFVVVLNFFNTGIKNVFYAFSSPIQKTFWTAGESCSGLLGSFLNAGSLNKENQNLKNEVQQLQGKIAALQAVVGGNRAQSAVSSACQNNEFKLLMAGVTGLDSQDMLSLNKGSADGISEGMPVINQQGALYGKVVKVYNNFSKVMLISSKKSIISVKVQQQEVKAEGEEQSKEVEGVIKGSEKLSVYLDLVPVDETIKQGDILLTSSLEETFPKDLLVGTVTKIQKNDQNPYQQAIVKPFLTSSINNLFVILNYKR